MSIQKREIIGYLELIHCERVIVVQAITQNDNFTKADVVSRWRKRYGKKLDECQIKTVLLKKGQKTDDIEDQPLPDL